MLKLKTVFDFRFAMMRRTYGTVKKGIFKMASERGSRKTSYKTKQRDTLLAYLETVQGKHVTVSDICIHFASNGENIGQTTIYRHLEKMVDEGLVNKYTIDAGTPACFEYVAPDENCHRDMCFHCKCEKCGRLIHMHCEELEGIGRHLLEHHGFALNSNRTVFYGICDECSSSEASENKDR